MRRFFSATINQAKRKHQLYLLDVDGVLIRTDKTAKIALQNTFQHQGIKLPAEPTAKQLLADGGGPRKALIRLYPDLDKKHSDINEWLEVFSHYYHEADAKHTTLYPNVKKILAALYPNVKLATASSKPQNTLERTLERFGLVDFFDEVIGSNEKTAPDKPSEKFFTELIQPHYPSLPPTQILMVGDVPKDIEFAHRCGMDSCLYTPGYGDLEECYKESPTFEIDDLMQLEKIHSGELKPIDTDTAKISPSL
ncbi:MAG: HAD family hydrolase [Gammaproteobacteria bacterium]|nr:HAD family hydrolase [Gammaproteobacteria bacterium]